jgi:hypothetical protein
MAHHERFMSRVGERWIVRCRPCGGRSTTQVFDSPSACHEWWRTHSATDQHRHNISPVARAQRVAFRREQRFREGTAGRELRTQRLAALKQEDALIRAALAQAREQMRAPSE